MTSGPSDTVPLRSSDAPTAAAWLQKQPFLPGRTFKREAFAQEHCDEVLVPDNDEHLEDGWIDPITLENCLVACLLLMFECSRSPEVASRLLQGNYPPLLE